MKKKTLDEEGLNNIIGSKKSREIFNIGIEGVIIKNEDTKLTSYLYSNGSTKYLRYDYQVRSGRYWYGLFFIRFDRNECHYNVRLKHTKKQFFSSEYQTVGAREEKLLEKLKKKDIGKGYDNKTSWFSANNPVQFCTIPFLEEEVKNWILIFGQQNYSGKEIDTIIKSLAR
jgi:hypothetical protein